MLCTLSDFQWCFGSDATALRFPSAFQTYHGEVEGSKILQHTTTGHLSLVGLRRSLRDILWCWRHGIKRGSGTCWSVRRYAFSVSVVLLPRMLRRSCHCTDWSTWNRSNVHEKRPQRFAASYRRSAGVANASPVEQGTRSMQECHLYVTWSRNLSDVWVALLW